MEPIDLSVTGINHTLDGTCTVTNIIEGVADSSGNSLTRVYVPVDSVVLDEQSSSSEQSDTDSVDIDEVKALLEDKPLQTFTGKVRGKRGTIKNLTKEEQLARRRERYASNRAILDQLTNKVTLSKSVIAKYEAKIRYLEKSMAEFQCATMKETGVYQKRISRLLTERASLKSQETIDRLEFLVNEIRAVRGANLELLLENQHLKQQLSSILPIPCLP